MIENQADAWCRFCNRIVSARHMHWDSGDYKCVLCTYVTRGPSSPDWRYVEPPEKLT